MSRKNYCLLLISVFELKKGLWVFLDFSVEWFTFAPSSAYLQISAK